MERASAWRYWTWVNVGQPISYRVDGKQYIAVQSGYGGVTPFWGGKKVAPLFHRIPLGGTLYVFSFWQCRRERETPFDLGLRLAIGVHRLRGSGGADVVWNRLLHKPRTVEMGGDLAAHPIEIGTLATFERARNDLVERTSLGRADLLVGYLAQLVVGEVVGVRFLFAEDALLPEFIERRHQLRLGAV